MQVGPGIHQLKIPLPNSPLGFLNSYLVKTPEGSLLIDTGWNTDEAFLSLARQLQDAGAGFGDLSYIVATHGHPDHYGLVGRLMEQTRAKLVIHEIERSFLHSRYVQYDTVLEEMDHWLRINGVPDESRPALQRASLPVLGLVAVAMPDTVVRGGEHIKLGDFDLEVIWTPGHSQGHICLYDSARRILFAGDHVLPKITPNVSMHSQSMGNPLADYLNSLNQVAQLPVELVLPAHENIFTDLPHRIQEIKQHHRDRQQEIVRAFAGGPKTGYQIASRISWSTNGVPWAELTPFVRRMAVTETLAHLEMLFTRQVLNKTLVGGIVLYVPNNQAH